MSEAKPTPGPWRADGEEVCSDSVSCIAYCCAAAPFAGWSGTDFSGESFREANARLIADAGTIYHQTGLTPSQLVEQRDGLAALLREIYDDVLQGAIPDRDDEWFELTSAALAKSTSIGDTQCKTTN